ncbi:uncharacterized protein LOC111203525 [Brassica napus]|uniref:uncharacterized protein LOC111203525 n=1 Tax=Brassica napus TaxID=3708 RepID=UPI000BBF1B93|nr:uncharacterized protein LOC111203525 [Brassica napus]
MIAELQRYRERFGDQMREESADGTPRQADARGNVPGVGVHHRHPPPPPPFVPVHVHGPSYWEVMKYMRDMQMDRFSGKASATSANNWRRKLEKNLDAARCPAKFRRELGVHYLKDEAMIWWEGVVELARGHYELTWEEFKDEFTREYVPPEATYMMESEFENLRQGNKTVKDYKEEFNRLRRFSRRRMEERDLIRKFMNGLRVDLKNRCALRKYDRLAEIVETTAFQGIGLEEESKLARNTKPKTAKCNQHGHTKKDCRFPPNVRCYRGYREDHTSSACPLPPQGAPKAGAPQQGTRRNEQLPPPKKQAVGGRAFVVGDHEGGEPIIGSVLVGGINAHTLFDTGATHSFVSPTLTKCWNFEGMFLSNAKGIETAGTELMRSTGTYEDVPIVIEGIELKGNLVEMELNHYEVILGMNWLTYHKAVMDFPKTRVYIPRT